MRKLVGVLAVLISTIAIQSSASTCTDLCFQQWRECRSECNNGWCFIACDEEYQSCRAGCA